MTTGIGLVLSALVGIAAGAAFFAGLWWTARRVPDAGHPALLVVTSYALRLVGAGVVLVAVGGDRWERWVAVLVGFVLGRTVVQRRVTRHRRTA